MADKRVEYTIGVRNEGLENLTRVIDELDKAGVETTEFKRQAEQLRQQLGEMARQQSLIDSFVKIKQETVSTGTAFEAAQAKAQQLGRELAATDAPTKKQTAEFGRAREAVNSTKDAYQAAQLRLQAMRGTLADNNIETAGLAQKQVALRNGVREVDASVAGATARLKDLGGAGPKAVNDTAAATDRAATSAKGYQGALTQVASAVAGAFAVSKVVDYAKSVQEVSDQYKNLEAKVRLAIGAQGDLQSSVRGVGEVAQATHSSLDGTAQLFGRLAASAKELNITNTEALGVTKTINQAIQVSGASAQASEAAVIQLVQALQSGVLRGDEFNSIMEQAPRLSRALADGLGVPVGALRALAEQGQLTSTKVVQALKGQSEAIDKEFSTLPLTVGRALTNLQTQWTLFVGGLTGGAAQSSIAAQGINALANNLDTLAGVAARAGSVLTAALAVQGVQALRAFAVEMAATGKAASLMSLELSKVPKVINITVAAVGFEVGFQIGEMLRENSELARKLGVGLVGFMQALVNDLVFLKEAAAAIFTSDTIDAAFDRYIARGKELDQILDGMWKDAENAPSKISGAADAGVGSLGKLGGAGAAAGQAVASGGAQGAAGVGKIAKAAEDARTALSGLATAINTKPAASTAIAEIVRDLTAAKLRGEDLDLLLRQKMPEAISKLSGPELVKFRADFVVAMDAAKKALQDAIDTKKPRAEIDALRAKVDSFERATRTGLGLIAEQAAQNLGIDVPAAFGKMSQGFKDAQSDISILIRQLPELKAVGVDTGAVVAQALAKMLDGAKNQAEIDAVIARVKTLRKELGDKLADGLLDQAKQKSLDLKDAMDGVLPGINSVREAMKQLGITSDETLKKAAVDAKEAYDTLAVSGTASAREMGEAFKATAEKAIAANKGIAPSWVEAHAAARGYKIEVDAAGKATLVAMSGAAGSHGVAIDAARQHTSVVRDLAAAYSDAGAKALAAQGQFLAAAAAQKSADTSASSITNRPGSESQFAWTRLAIMDWLKQAGLDEETSKKISGEFVDSSGNVPYINNGGQIKYAGKNSTMTQALHKAAEQHIFANKQDDSTSAPTPPSGGGGSGGSGGSTYTNNVTINGVGDWGVVRGTTRHTDAQSAQTEIDLLRQLAQAKGASI
ncbi:hypothetical protein B2J88_20275 [Rhodococcus sp. SRB_17]|uniref:tape measure protein n=1 Tax=Acidovorax sp. SRB_24 TaxID=1962700 RepID=UPI00145F3A6B|nr:tape measure protein [Acidovorax sp. SRB_24]NMM75388.1 hypothetical protein [Acidovorax sp. SRB_24]NMM86675.1 hypothetical protein [Rhodococcus sp. SRB_17]